MVMLENKFKDHQLILASGSPRRQALFKELGLEFTVRTKEIDEHYSAALKAHEITEFLAGHKALAYKNDLDAKEVLIAADTIVWHHGKAIEKPANRNEAIAMLEMLSGEAHEVITSVCILTTGIKKIITEYTTVFFKELSSDEITYYVDKYKPYDKAGGYGIQEWIGFIGVSKIDGCYYNVMGLPVKNLYQELKNLSL
jgi:septum formation protein